MVWIVNNQLKAKMKSTKVKLTNPSTCRAIFKVTKDPNHFRKCPIIMEKSIWLAIKPSVMMKKDSTEGVDAVFDSLMDMFGGMK